MEDNKQKSENKIKDLKERLKDKSLSMAQRQVLMQEIAKESYKLDERKSISLHNHRLLQFWGFFLFCIETIFGMITSAIGIDDNIIVTIITLILCVAALIFIILWLCMSVSRKIELEDELAKENLNKARAGISASVMFLLLFIMAVTLAIDTFTGIDITISLDVYQINRVAMLMLWSYFALESGLFLWYEGRTSFYTEEENE